MSALVKGKRDWPAVLSLGFSIDRNGKRRKPVWINIVTLGILLPGFAMWGLYRVFTTPTGVGLWALAAVMYLFTMFGVTLGNHRYWTHRGFEARFTLQVVLAVASGMSMEGDIQQWVMNHRAHHRFADVVGKDPHSPYEYPGWRGYQGLVWAQGVWLFFRIRAAAGVRAAPRPGPGPAGAMAAPGVPVPGRGELPRAAGVLPAVWVERCADSRSAAHSSPHDGHRFRQLHLPQMGQPGHGQPRAPVPRRRQPQQSVRGCRGRRRGKPQLAPRRPRLPPARPQSHTGRRGPGSRGQARPRLAPRRHLEAHPAPCHAGPDLQGEEAKSDGPLRRTSS